MEVPWHVMSLGTIMFLVIHRISILGKCIVLLNAYGSQIHTPLSLCTHGSNPSWHANFVRKSASPHFDISKYEYGGTLACDEVGYSWHIHWNPLLMDLEKFQMLVSYTQGNTYKLCLITPKLWSMDHMYMHIEIEKEQQNNLYLLSHICMQHINS